MAILLHACFVSSKAKYLGSNKFNIIIDGTREQLYAP